MSHENFSLTRPLTASNAAKDPKLTDTPLWAALHWLGELFV
jgi:hypothetical protein